MRLIYLCSKIMNNELAWIFAQANAAPKLVPLECNYLDDITRFKIYFFRYQDCGTAMCCMTNVIGQVVYSIYQTVL